MTAGGKREGSGRKKAIPGEKRVQMVVTINPSTRDRLKVISKKEGVAVGRLIDNLIEKHHEEE